jgi:hypothetical protein
MAKPFCALTDAATGRRPWATARRAGGRLSIDQLTERLECQPARLLAAIGEIMAAPAGEGGRTIEREVQLADSSPARPLRKRTRTAEIRPLAAIPVVDHRQADVEQDRRILRGERDGETPALWVVTEVIPAGECPAARRRPQDERAVVTRRQPPTGKAAHIKDERVLDLVLRYAAAPTPTAEPKGVFSRNPAHSVRHGRSGCVLTRTEPVSNGRRISG